MTQMWKIQDERLPRAETAAPELPAPDTERWTPRRKASVVKAVLSGVMGLEEICHRYGLSVEEFSSWNDAMHKHGMRGLYTTKLQKYRYFPTRSLNVQPSPQGVSVTPHEYSRIFAEGLACLAKHRASTSSHCKPAAQTASPQRGLALHDFTTDPHG